MSVDLSIKIPPNANLKTIGDEKNIEEKVMEKYPLLELDKGEARFKGINKCDYYFDIKRGELGATSNGALYNYVVYTLYAFADILGVNEIFDPQDGKTYPLSDYKQIIEDVPLELDIERKQPLSPDVYRLYPTDAEKFTVTQIMQAVDKINEKSKDLRFELSDSGYELIAFFDKDKKTETLWIDLEYRFIEVKVLATKEVFDSYYNKIFKELSASLPANLKKL